MEIPAIKLIPVPDTAEAKQAVGYESNEEAGTRHRLGGRPEWVQSDETPSCSDCGKIMTFYGQLDSIGDGYDLADCGLIYVFVCFDCFTTVSILQSY